MLEYHATGRWLPGEVELRWAGSAYRSTPEIDALIATAWAAAKARLGDKLFDGPMCRLERFETFGSTLRLFVSRTSYRIFTGTNMAHPELPDESRANPVGVSTVLITADRFLMLGRRSGNVAYYPHRLHPFAGTLEPGGVDALDVEPLGTGGLQVPDLFENARRELLEELQLPAGNITEIACLGLVEDMRLRHPETILYARTDLDRRRLESQLLAHEHDQAWFCPATPAAIDAALENPAEMTPVAVAALNLVRPHCEAA